MDFDDSIYARAGAPPSQQPDRAQREQQQRCGFGDGGNQLAADSPNHVAIHSGKAEVDAFNRVGRIRQTEVFLIHSRIAARDGVESQRQVCAAVRVECDRRIVEPVGGAHHFRFAAAAGVMDRHGDAVGDVVSTIGAGDEEREQRVLLGAGQRKGAGSRGAVKHDRVVLTGAVGLQDERMVGIVGAAENHPGLRHARCGGAGIHTLLVECRSAEAGAAVHGGRDIGGAAGDGNNHVLVVAGRGNRSDRGNGRIDGSAGGELEIRDGLSCRHSARAAGQADDRGRAAGIALQVDVAPNPREGGARDRIGHRFRQCQVRLLVAQRDIDRIARSDIDATGGRGLGRVTRGHVGIVFASAAAVAVVDIESQRGRRRRVSKPTPPPAPPRRWFPRFAKRPQIHPLHPCCYRCR